MTHDLKALMELEKRLVEAKGWDREIDVLLWAELDGRDVRYDGDKVLAKSRKPPHDECLLGFIDPGKVSRNFSAADGHRPVIDTVTASLDAAVALVERVLPGWWWKMEANGGQSKDLQFYTARVYTVEKIGGDADNLKERYAAAPQITPALALCLAAVRALISQGEQ